MEHRLRLFSLAASIVVVVASCTCGSALAIQTARLYASFSPERPGAPTTIFLSFRITSSSVGSLLPLTNVSLFLPNEMGLATSGLGLRNCVPARLEAFGPPGCPAASLMGRGIATAEIPIEGDSVAESAQIDVFSAPVQNGRLALMVYANALSPVLAQLVFPASVVPAVEPYGEGIDTNVPLVPTIPGGPDVAVTRFQMTLGSPQTGTDSFVYYHRAGGRRTAYTPPGLILPPFCPRGGFPFKAQFVFQGGSVTTARTFVSCPGRR
jgi:hypothetical protein